MDKRRVGSFYEEVAKNYLEKQNVEILETNYRCRSGEVDIIGKQDDTLIFFEVKYRKNDDYGSALSAIDKKKQKKIIACAKYYTAFDHTDCYVRFDAIGIEKDKIEWIKDAFWMNA